MKTIHSKFGGGRPLLSAEFYPPKTEEGARQLMTAAHALKSFDLDFVSITYGAGGSTRGLTCEYADLLANVFGFTVLPHLTCISHSKKEIESILEGLDSRGMKNIMSLRGDFPKGQTATERGPFQYASDLVRFIKGKYPEMCLGVGGYPETHPQAISIEKDIEYLRGKVAAGADFITTQLFFDNRYFFEFVTRCRSIGITVPIIAGIMIPCSLPQIESFSQLSKATIPQKLKESLSAASSESEALEVGTRWASTQINELLSHHVDGIHLYTLNRSAPAISILREIRRVG
ncbi:MAG: methylenetetrahydrofolate reductase [NAD(P)H] [Verrucomicrobia bacterium GWC2_42_7]|nr:MAG: methylenetetrahydrofolate reductase [NAD(P)H] [Verrucomicrobia bacterium GWC2_42_7]